MPDILPPFLGAKNNTVSSPHVTAHAQNFSTSMLNQQKERNEAKVSMNRVLRAKEGSEGGGPSTSVFHHQDPSYDDTTLYSDEEREEIRTRLRYAHIRELMKEKQQRQSGDMQITTGAGKDAEMHKSITAALNAHSHPAYVHLSKTDKMHLEEILRHGSREGFGHSRGAKKRMGTEAWNKYTSGAISRADYKTFKQIIRGLD